MLFILILLCIFHQTKSCPLTDEFLSRCHCGILTNGESYIECEPNSLEKMPIFKRSFPYDELRLTNNFIRHLTNSTFDNIKTIKRINLDGNRLTSIDVDLLKLLGNYLEELILSGDDQIDSVEFLTRFPLKKLRFLKLSRFDLSRIDVAKIFSNLTKLEHLVLHSCQLREIPQLDQLVHLELEGNFLQGQIFLSTSYSRLNLANNRIESIVLQKNPSLVQLNLSGNRLTELYTLPKFHSKLNFFDLSSNRFSFVDATTFAENLTNLNFDKNRLTKIDFEHFPKTLVELILSKNFLEKIEFSKKKFQLKRLDLSWNQLKTLEKNSLIFQLNELNLNENPLECDCRLEWLKIFVNRSTINGSTWRCSKARNSNFLSADFQCSTTTTMSVVRVDIFNVTPIHFDSKFGFFIHWKLVDPQQIVRYLQISVQPGPRLSKKLSSNQSFVHFFDEIDFNQRYEFCLIVVHRNTRDRYCREMFVDQIHFESIDSIVENSEEIFVNEFNDDHLHLLLIGSCIGGVLTVILLFVCCVLSYQIGLRSKKFHLPIGYEHFHRSNYSSSLPRHQTISHSDSSDMTQIDSSFSSAVPNPIKHIYQTIDSRDYCSLTRSDKHLFDFWNDAVQQQQRR